MGSSNPWLQLKRLRASVKTLITKLITQVTTISHHQLLVSSCHKQLNHPCKTPRRNNREVREMMLGRTNMVIDRRKLIDTDSTTLPFVINVDFLSNRVNSMTRRAKMNCAGSVMILRDWLQETLLLPNTHHLWKIENISNRERREMMSGEHIVFIDRNRYGVTDTYGTRVPLVTDIKVSLNKFNWLNPTQPDFWKFWKAFNRNDRSLDPLRRACCERGVCFLKKLAESRNRMLSVRMVWKCYSCLLTNITDMAQKARVRDDTESNKIIRGLQGPGEQYRKVPFESFQEAKNIEQRRCNLIDTDGTIIPWVTDVVNIIKLDELYRISYVIERLIPWKTAQHTSPVRHQKRWHDDTTVILDADIKGSLDKFSRLSPSQPHFWNFWRPFNRNDSRLDPLRRSCCEREFTSRRNWQKARELIPGMVLKCSGWKSWCKRWHWIKQS